jgi:hypothetical protein
MATSGETVQNQINKLRLQVLMSFIVCKSIDLLYFRLGRTNLKCRGVTGITSLQGSTWAWFLNRKLGFSSDEEFISASVWQN